MYKLMEVIRSL